MITEQNVDYLSFNCKDFPVFLREVEVAPSYIGNYERMTICEDGTTVHHGNKVTDKYKVVMQGTQCLEMQLEFGVKGFMEVVGSCNPSVTRLDVAVTQYIDHDGLITVDDFRDYYEVGLIHSKHVKHGSTYLEQRALGKSEKTSQKGHGFYIGDWKRRAKHGIIRIYDKGLDMNLDEYLITRIEVEEKRKDAQTSFNRLLNGATVAQVLKSRMDVADDYYQKVLDCEPVDITRGKSASQKQFETYQDESFKRWEWFLGTVAKAYGRLIADDHRNGIDNTDLQREFLEIVQSSYDENS